MLPEAIELQVVTPERHVLSENVQSLEMPAKDGYLGVLPGHAPLITLLGVGTLTYHKGGETRYLTVIDGFAEVLPDRVIVLAENSERAEEIDVARSRAELERAQTEAAKPGILEAESREAEAQIARATARLQTASKGGSSATQDSHHSSH
ncbi:MAG TPA: F0F1 ATP synthase subunit epsilon [Candidatus Acidoferrales bacterium]|nr:F0F1 ATP synthase subunit epsilon [Candidatus Acidoferrales bacterium]